MRRIAKIYVHCSASAWGTVQEITRWHIERGWRTIGYHWVITNLFPTWISYKDRIPVPEYNGKLWVGRPVDEDDILEPAEVGAHVKGENEYSLAVCVVGDEVFTSNQHDTLIEHLAYLCHLHELGHDMCRGHSEHWTDRGLPPGKSCPNIDMAQVRERVRVRLAHMRAIAARHGEISGLPDPGHG